MESLWGKIPEIANRHTPNSFLSQQGKLLGEVTDNKLVGETRRTDKNGKFHISFFIKALDLNNYRYELLRVVHDVTLYPLLVVDNDDRSLKCDDEAEFEAAIREILSAPGTTRIIEALLLQIKEDTDDIPF